MVTRRARLLRANLLHTISAARPTHPMLLLSALAPSTPSALLFVRRCDTSTRAPALLLLLTRSQDLVTHSDWTRSSAPPPARLLHCIPPFHFCTHALTLWSSRAPPARSAHPPLVSSIATPIAPARICFISPSHRNKRPLGKAYLDTHLDSHLHGDIRRTWRLHEIPILLAFYWFALQLARGQHLSNNINLTSTPRQHSTARICNLGLGTAGPTSSTISIALSTASISRLNTGVLASAAQVDQEKELLHRSLTCLIV